MAIFLRQELTSRLIHTLHGGFDQLAAAWEELAESRPGFPKPKQRSSVYRWLMNGVPTKRHWGRSPDLQYFGLCALLDVDPLAIFDFERNGYFSRFSAIREALYIGPQRLGSLASIVEMYRPGPNWPSDLVATKCYGRNWFASEFTSREDWQLNCYFLVRAVFDLPTNTFPRGVHIAYRLKESIDRMWRYYGTVLAVDGDLHLYSENGDYQTMRGAAQMEIKFRTYFSGRAVQWRVASLHSFSLDIEMPFDDVNVIGFKW